MQLSNIHKSTLDKKRKEILLLENKAQAGDRMLVLLSKTVTA
jgi:hypothetical protein